MSMTTDFLVNRLVMTNAAMERAAWLADSLTLDDIPEGIIESTGSSMTLLIEVRENKDVIKRLRAGAEVYDSE